MKNKGLKLESGQPFHAESIILINQLKEYQTELLIANKELAYQNEEKAKRAAELLIANKELAYQNEEKAKRAAELLIANKELTYQNEEKAKRAAELLIANKELTYQNEEKIKRAAELFSANEKIALQEGVILANNKAVKLSHELEVQQIELLAANEEIRQSEQRFQALVEWSPYAALVHSNIKIVYVNPAAVKLFGATSEQDLLGTPVMRWHHPDYHQIVRERIRRATEEGLPAPMIESKYFKLDGTVMDLEVQGKPIIYNGLPSVLATFNDVTERRIIERQLDERHKELQAFYFLSQLSERQDLPLAGICREFADFLPNSCQHPEVACCRILMNGTEFRTKNFGDSAWKLSAPIKSDGIEVGMIEVAYLKEMPLADEGPFLTEESKLLNALAQQLGEIIEHRNAEQEKVRQSGLITSLLDSIPDIVFYKDTEGIYLGCNPAFTVFVGKSKQDIVGKTDYDLFSHDVADFFRHHDTEMMKLKLPHQNEEWVTYPDGRIVLLDTLKTPYYDSNGILIGMLGVSRNITDRKLAENKIRETSKELQKINAEKDKFFSIIAHDLRSPFNGFLGLTHLMAEESQGLTPDEIRDISMSLKNSAANMFRLLENLLEWSKMQQGLIPFNPAIAHLLPIVQGSMSVATESAKIKGIEIIYDIPEDLTIYADINMLLTVLRNLASNAIKFTPRGGKINISAKASGESIEISIQDTGIGMGQGMLNLLFRLDTKTNRAGTGGEPSSGLGLILCKDFIEKHNGKIRAKSEEGKGSTFIFTLPHPEIQDGKTDTKPVTVSGSAIIQSRNLKILIAEDDVVSANFLALAVRKLSNEVIKVRTGKEAVDACRNNPDIDLILMDIALPGINGQEATRQIRQFNQAVVIIAQTANVFAGERELSLEAGCNDFITKPVKQTDLRELIIRHCFNSNP